MENKLTSWLEEHAGANPTLSYQAHTLLPNTDLVNISSLSIPANGMVGAESPEPVDPDPDKPVDQEFIISIGQLVGSNKEELQTIDNELGELFDKNNPIKQPFLDKYQNAPVTGMASILGFCQRGNFIPANGHDTPQEFNEFIAKVFQCPLFSTPSHGTINGSKNYTHKDKAYNVEELSRFILGYFNLSTQGDNSSLAIQLNKKLEEINVDTTQITIHIYNMELFGDTTESNFKVAAGKVIITRTKEKHVLKDTTYKFEASASGLTLTTSLPEGNWEDNAAKIAETHFSTIAEWENSINL